MSGALFHDSHGDLSRKKWDHDSWEVAVPKANTIVVLVTELGHLRSTVDAELTPDAAELLGWSLIRAARAIREAAATPKSRPRRTTA